MSRSMDVAIPGGAWPPWGPCGLIHQDITVLGEAAHARRYADAERKGIDIQHPNRTSRGHRTAEAMPSLAVVRVKQVEARHLEMMIERERAGDLFASHHVEAHCIDE